MTMLYPRAISLYQLLHEGGGERRSLNQLLIDESPQVKVFLKYNLALQIAQILMTVHNLASIKAHGHLTSHNLFIELKRTSK